MRFLGLGLAGAVPDANTIWSFREALKKADAVDALFSLRRGAARSRLSGDERTDRRRDDCRRAKAAQYARGKEGEPGRLSRRPGRLSRRPGWPDRPAATSRPRAVSPCCISPSSARRDPSARASSACPSNSPECHKNHVSIDRGFGLIRKWTATQAATHDSARLEDVLDRTNTASDVWADTERPCLCKSRLITSSPSLITSPSCPPRGEASVSRRADRAARACPGSPVVTKTGEFSNAITGENPLTASCPWRQGCGGWR